MGTSGNPIDTDLISPNIKDGVNIFGIEGDYVGTGLGGLESAQSIYSDDTVVNDRLSAGIDVDFNGPGTPYVFEYGNNIYMVCVGGKNSSPTLVYITMFSLDKSTGIITRIYVDNGLYISDPASIGASSVYLDGDYIYVNISGYSPIGYFKYDLTNDTAIVIGGEYISGVMLSASTTSGGKTFTGGSKNPVGYLNRGFIRHISVT